MANINILPAISILGIVNYIGKYCSKEKKINFLLKVTLISIAVRQQFLCL